MDVHWHDFYELASSSADAADHVVNGERRELGPGSAFLLLTGRLPRARARSGPAAGLLQRRSSTRPSSSAQLAGSVPVATPALPLAGRRLRRRRAPTSAGSNGVGRDGMGSAALSRGAGLTASGRAGSPVRRTQPTVRRRRRARPATCATRSSYVDRHFREPLTLAESRRRHTCRRTTSASGSRVTGMPFQTYLQNRRLRFAHVAAEASTAARGHRGLSCGRLQQPVALRPRVSASLRRAPSAAPTGLTASARRGTGTVTQSVTCLTSRDSLDLIDKAQGRRRCFPQGSQTICMVRRRGAPWFFAGSSEGAGSVKVQDV